MRHAGRTAAPIASRFGRLAHFELHEQRNIERDLSQACGIDGECGHQRSQTVPVSVPGSVGKLQVEFRRKRLTHRQAAMLQCRERAACPAKLEIERLVKP